MLDERLLAALRRRPEVAHYFRYPLRPADFAPLACAGRFLGHYCAKPLYARLTPAGRVDRSAAYDGRLAVLFLPDSAQEAAHARLLFTSMPPERIADARGHRRWPAIRAAAEHTLCEFLPRG